LLIFRFAGAALRTPAGIFVPAAGRLMWTGGEQIPRIFPGSRRNVRASLRVVAS
jgi:hypothetical protein